MSDRIYTPTESPPITGGTTPNDPTVQSAKQDLRAAAAEARAAASQAAGTVKQEAAAAAETIKQEGQGILNAVQDRAQGAVEEGKRMGVEQVDGIARAIHRAASELEGTSPQLASFVHDAAGSIDNIARSLRESGPSDMVQGVTDFARRNPLAFFGASVLAGFAIARFARASSPRVQHAYGDYEEYGSGYGEAGAEYTGYVDPAYSGTASGTPGADYVSGASGSFSGDRTGVSGADMGHGITGTSGTTSSQGTTYGGAASGGMSTGSGTGTGGAHETSSGAPGWVAGDDGTTRPATLASASLGGAAAKQTPGQTQFDRDDSAGSKS
jgi:hypothetical protein